jgi:hypothetical protein
MLPLSLAYPFLIAFWYSVTSIYGFVQMSKHYANVFWNACILIRNDMDVNEHD